jgi:hypothetical protein
MYSIQADLEPNQPLVKWVLRALSLEVKQPRHEASLSTLSSAKFKIAWSYTSTLPSGLPIRGATLTNTGEPMKKLSSFKFSSFTCDFFQV